MYAELRRLHPLSKRFLNYYRRLVVNKVQEQLYFTFKSLDLAGASPLASAILLKKCEYTSLRLSLNLSFSMQDFLIKRLSRVSSWQRASIKLSLTFLPRSDFSEIFLHL